MTSPYDPPAELVERARTAMVKDDPIVFGMLSREEQCQTVCACLAASGLGEALGLLHRFVTEWQLERNDPQFSDPLAAEARALLSRLDPQK